jgi:ParB family chromosome partitioning protein
MILTLPLDSIDAEALPRDRSAADPEALAELQASIAASGQRQPIEVFELAEPEGPLRYGLISGWRRLHAIRTLAARDPARPATVAALVRTPTTLAEAMAEMVEENDIRATLSPWEQGRVALTARSAGIFPTLDAAIDGLYPSATRQRRARLRSLARVAEALEGALDTPEQLTLRQMLRLATALRAEFAPLLRHVAAEQMGNGLAAQWQALLPVLDEAEASLKDPTPYAPGRPRRLVHLPRRLVLRRERTPRGWSLHLTGPDATAPLMERLIDEVERLVGSG